MKFLALILLVLPLAVMALEVDEKLTIRIVKTSETRKTVMINRGTEDGLIEGDHAKFVVTAGIVARGVIVKVSPTRSIWSIYRLVNADFIVNDAVMTIKITPPVKITKDESQALVQEDTPSRAKSPTELGIPLADGAQDIVPAEEAAAELKALTEGEEAPSLVERTREIIGVINISGLTANSKTETGDDSFNSTYSYHHIGLGGEWYAQKEREWYSRFSVTGFLNIMRLNAQAYNGAGVTNDLTEFSIGANWHPTKMPSMAMAFIPYFHFSANMGTIKSTYSPGANNIGGPEFASTGSTSGFSAGLGYKFFTVQGFGARALLDYYFRTEKYKEDDLLNVHSRVVGGPRLMLGISYRF